MEKLFFITFTIFFPKLTFIEMTTPITRTMNAKRHPPKTPKIEIGSSSNDFSL